MKTIAVFLLFLVSSVSALDVEGVLKLAEKWQVPQPDKNSEIVKIWAFASGDDDCYMLGFIEPKHSKRALVGFRYIDDEHKADGWKKFDGTLEDVVGVDTFGDVHGLNEGLITGIQLIRMGKREVGIKLIEKSLKEDAGHGRSPFYIPENLEVKEALTRSCLSAALNEITTEKPDFKKIKDKIEMILKENPKLKTAATIYYLEALTANVNHPKPEKGSIEEVVENYLMSGSRQGTLNGIAKVNVAKKTLVLKGFAAIPTLLKHLDDKRMTNHLMVGFNNFVSHPMRADKVVNNYLQSFANNEMGSNWLERQKGVSSDRYRVTRWWKKASAMGEEKYVQKYTLVKTKDGMDLSSELLILAVDRYPELLPELYRRAISSKMHSWPVAEVFVAHPKIKIETKVDLLTKAIATGKDEHRNAALRGLISLKSDKANTVLLKLINNASKTTKTEYWKEQNAYLAMMVSKSNNVELWKAILAFIKRADLGMRMELINKLNPAKDAPKEVLEIFFQVYDLYQDDKAVRNIASSPKFGGPGAGFPHDVISVRDFVNMEYARWMGFKAELPDKKKIKVSDWDKCREKAKAKIKAYRIKKGLLR